MTAARFLIYQIIIFFLVSLKTAHTDQYFTRKFSKMHICERSEQCAHFESIA